MRDEDLAGALFVLFHDEHLDNVLAPKRRTDVFRVREPYVQQQKRMLAVQFAALERCEHVGWRDKVTLCQLHENIRRVAPLLVDARGRTVQVNVVELDILGLNFVKHAYALCGLVVLLLARNDFGENVADYILRKRNLERNGLSVSSLQEYLVAVVQVYERFLVQFHQLL